MPQNMTYVEKKNNNNNKKQPSAQPFPEGATLPSHAALLHGSPSLELLSIFLPSTHSHANVPFWLPLL